MIVILKLTDTCKQEVFINANDIVMFRVRLDAFSEDRYTLISLASRDINVMETPEEILEFLRQLNHRL